MIPQRCSLLFTSSLLFFSAAFAGDPKEINLDRIEPVPATETIPIADFFRPRLLQSPRLNPSGTLVAALVTTGEDRRELLVHDLEKKSSYTMRGSGDKDIYTFTWLSDNRLVYMLSTQKLYGLGLMALDTGRSRKSYPLLQYAGAHLVSVPRKNRERPLVWMRWDMFDRRDSGVAVINTALDTGPMVDLTVADTHHSDAKNVETANDRHVVSRYPMPKGGIGAGYFADRDGELAFAITADDGVPTLHRLVDGAWLRCPVDLDKTEMVSAGRVPGEAVVLAPQEPGKPRALRFLDTATGELGETLVQDKAYDFHGWVFRDRVSGEIVGAVYDQAGPRTLWFDEGYRAVQQTIERSFPGQVVRIIDTDETGRFLVETFTDRQPAIYHLADLKNRSMGLVKKSAPWIDPERMRPMNVMKFKTRDGKQLDAYLTLPAGATKENPPPLVVLPHGGPWVRDTWGFDGEVQFLVSRGYAVLKPNYRGSPGYDWMFPEEDRFAFRKMHDDVTDAAKALVAAKLVDPSRIAIMGGSFGAYLSISGVAHEPEFYRCAVAIAGVFDWQEVMKDLKWNQHSSPGYAYLKRKMGDPKKDAEKFEAISPIRFANQIRVPVFVSHGKEDFVARVAESKRLVNEFEKHRVPHETLFVRGEGHGMAHLKNQVELYARIEGFLAKHLAPRAGNR